MPVDVGEAEIPALVSIGEFSVVDPQQMQDRGIEVVNVHATRGPVIFGGLGEDWVAVGVGDVVAVVVTAAIGNPWLHAASCHPGRETAGVVVPPIILFREFTLTVSGAAKFSAPDDEGVLEHASFLQVGDERGASLINILAL